MLNYDDAKSKVFAAGRIPNGYFGDTAAVEFALIGQRIVTVAECGCFNAGLPLVVDEDEAFWILQRHPTSNATRLRRL